MQIVLTVRHGPVASTRQMKTAARLYISHFVQVLNLAVIRLEVRTAHLAYYGLEKNSKNSVPDLSTESALVEWGRKIVDGETKRLSQGGIDLQPHNSKSQVHYDIFMDSYEKQRSFQSLTARSLEALAWMRTEADRLILDIWNQVEKKFEEVIPQ